MKKATLLICLLLASGTVLAAKPVKSFSADYHLLFNGDHVGDVRFSLQLRLDNQYSFEAFTRPAGTMSGNAAGHEVLEASSGSLRGGTPVPEHYYTAVRTADGTNMLEYFYDWKSMTLTRKDDNNQQQSQLKNSTQDRLSYLLHAMKLAESHKNLASVPLITSAGTKQLSMRKRNRRYMDTAAGRLLSQEFELSYGIGSPERRLWLSLDHGYLPVRLEKKTDGGIVRMELTEILQGVQ